MKKRYRAFLKKDKIILAEKLEIAESFKDRLLGLMFSTSLGPRDALMLTPCKSIHTFFMNYPIDVLFLDKENKIVKIYKNMVPWRMTGFCFRAEKVIELKGNSLPEKIKEDMELVIECIS